MKKAIASYIAGIIDGEGSIHIVTDKNKRLNRLRLKPEISISNTKIELLEYLKDNIPMSFIISKKQRNNYKHSFKFSKTKVIYELRITSYSQLKQTLPFLIPYLLIKKEQAQLMLNYLNYRTSISKRRYTNKDYKFKKQMEVLNK